MRSGYIQIATVMTGSMNFSSQASAKRMRSSTTLVWKTGRLPAQSCMTRCSRVW
nr:MAG TPA: hypothetical protein [Caudoviricetes sp.]